MTMIILTSMHGSVMFWACKEYLMLHQRIMVILFLFILQNKLVISHKIMIEAIRFGCIIQTDYLSRVFN